VQQIEAIPLALTRVADTQMLTAIAWRSGDPNPYLADQHGVVIGGYVYRGRAIPGLQGAYVFVDMTGPIWALGANGVVQLVLEAGGVQTSFGEDPDGELWLLTQQNGLFKLGPG
jgi:hypothetical protein